MGLSLKAGWDGVYTNNGYKVPFIGCGAKTGKMMEERKQNGKKEEDGRKERPKSLSACRLRQGSASFTPDRATIVWQATQPYHVGAMSCAMMH